MDTSTGELDTRKKVEQIFQQFFIKVTQAILQSRVPFPTSAYQKSKVNKWFSLEIEELDSITEDLAPWQSNIYLPLFIYVKFVTQNNEEILLELWKVSLDSSITRPSETAENIPLLYKKLVTLTRVIYGFLRLLPAFNFFRYCKRNKMAATKMVFEFRRDDYSNFNKADKPKEMKFEPIQSFIGKVNVSVLYSEQHSIQRYTVSDKLISSQFIISDYQQHDNEMTPPRNLAPISSPVAIDSGRGGSKPIVIPSSSSGSRGIAATPPSFTSQTLQNFANEGAFSPPFSSNAPLPSPGLSKQNFSITPPFSPSNASGITSNTTNVNINRIHRNPSFRTSISPFKDAPVPQDPLRMKITETPPTSDALYTAPPLDEGEDQLTKLMNALLVHDPVFDSQSTGKDQESEIGYFVTQCQIAPPLSSFNESDRATVQLSSLFDTLSLLQHMDTVS